MSKKIDRIISTAVPLPLENIDTDQIIPARFLKATDRTGFGKNLFRDWRYNTEGKAQPDFILNNPAYSGKIFIAGKNFGCGSSREHAAWAIKDYGFDVVISSFFADIFRNNALNNFLLPVQVSEDFLQQLIQTTTHDPSAVIDVNIEDQSITILKTGMQQKFGISAYKKNCLLHGFDDIDYLLNLRGEIETFEQQKMTTAG